jgi:hypothetical protein
VSDCLGKGFLVKSLWLGSLHVSLVIALVAELYRTKGSLVCKDPSHPFVYSLSEL